MRSEQRNRNLEHLRGMDKEEVRATKALVGQILRENRENPEVLESLARGERLGKVDVYALLKKAGHDFTNKQLDVFMYYVNPQHNGYISRRNLLHAASDTKFLNDSVTADLRDGLSIESSAFTQNSSVSGHSQKWSQQSKADLDGATGLTRRPIPAGDAREGPNRKVDGLQREVGSGHLGKRRAARYH